MEPTRQLPAIRLTQIAEIAAQLFSEQTGQDVQAIKTHFGAAYSEAKTIALIAVGMLCRIAGIDTMSRKASPLDALIAEGLKRL